MADPLLANHAAALSVPGSGKTALSGATSWISFANSGTQVLVIDTVGGEQAVSILLPSGMWPIRATAIYSSTTVTNIVGYWE
jgi:hypothetical protein